MNILRMNRADEVQLSRLSSSLLLAGLASLLLAGCAVGPDFKPPSAPKTSGYTAHPIKSVAVTPGVPGGTAQHFSEGGDIPGDWWTLFHSKPLDALIRQSLDNNHDLKAAQAALTVADEDVLAQRGTYSPNVAASFSASRQRQPTTLGSALTSGAFQYNLFTPQLSISYAPDLFGVNRRTVESLQAQEQAARFQMIAAWTTLTSNVVVAAVQEAALSAQVDATHQLIDINTRMLKVLDYQYQKGYASQIDVAAQESQLAQVNASLPPLVKQLEQQRHLLAVLVGKFPGDTPPQTFELSSLQLPGDLPLSLPSKLVVQRPDVRQAQANLHAASAQIGIAEANRFPNIELTADAGSTATAISKIFDSGTGFWGLAVAITQPIFEGGTLLHQERAAKAAYVEAAEQYRSTVLMAFQNVADTLTAIEQDARELQAAASAEQAAKQTLDLTQIQAQDGYADPLQLFNAEQSYQQARMTLVQAEAERFADTAALYQALGGGWWHHTNFVRK
ncbi:MAG TPA: efflux transporter outer membrane subunit [Gammaproteobacteria bacterium]|nr:efflux transporter outer membrane subunit [Gammaproteobacteria bacterium]